MQSKTPLEGISISSTREAESAEAEGLNRQLQGEGKETHNVQAQKVTNRERAGIRRKGRCLQGVASQRLGRPQESVKQVGAHLEDTAG